jgi:tetratricopeptide (TPR) repeat protein
MNDQLPSEQTILKLKDQANRSFTLGKFSSAREIYTEAIMMKPNNITSCSSSLLKLFSVLYSNRALAIKESSIISSSLSSSQQGQGLIDSTSSSTEVEAILPSSLAPWENIEKDCLAAIELDSHNAKAHYLLGICFCKKLEWVKGVKQLEHALEMAIRQGKPKSLLKEFEAAIAIERYQWHKSFYAEERQADDDLLSFYDGLLIKVSQDEVQALQQQGTLISNPYSTSSYSSSAMSDIEPSPIRGNINIRASTPSLAAAAVNRIRPGTAVYISDLNSSNSDSTNLDSTGSSLPTSSTVVSQINPREAARQALLESKKKTTLDSDINISTTYSVTEIEAAFLRRRADLADVFAEREQRRIPRQSAPVYYTCSITLEVMLDPVLTPCGHSYERVALEHYLKSVKAEDPLSRKFLSVEMLIPNIALRQAINAYLAENPWAHPLLPPQILKK